MSDVSMINGHDDAVVRDPMRENLIEILRKPIFPHELADPTEAVADYLLDNGVTLQKWISVTERLPEADTCVLAITANGSFKTARCNIYRNGTEVCWATNDGLGESAITHWMPLPQPPKEGE